MVHSDLKTFKIKIKRKVEPGLLEIFDIAQFNIDDTGYGDEMIVFGRLNDD